VVGNNKYTIGKTMDEYEYDEGSDLDNWETEQVFRDNEGDDEEDEMPPVVDRADKFLADLLAIMENIRH
jgi:hypothetical protein|tara:strand:+ start:15640 stop:15846 length:207 start_codon:yes stop_codon:yes gene_type:complete